MAQQISQAKGYQQTRFVRLGEERAHFYLGGWTIVRSLVALGTSSFDLPSMRPDHVFRCL